MDFRQDLTDFPSLTHKVIYAAARGMTPPEVSLAGCADTDMARACGQLYAFTRRMLASMYDEPEAYHLPAGDLERFLDGRRLNAVKQRFPSRTKRLLSHTRNAVHGYMLTLCLLGQAGDVAGDSLVVPEAAWKHIEKRVNAPSSPIALDTRLAALGRVGLTRRGNALSAPEYPLMPAALRAMAQTVDGKCSGFPYFNFCNAEFRQLAGRFKPAPEDYLRTLTPERRAIADAVCAAAEARGCKPTISTFWKIDYKYRGAQAVCVETTEGDLTVRVTATYNWDDPALINARLAGESPALQREALRRVWRCDACSTNHLGRFVTVLGKRQRVCGGGLIGFRWRNPCAADIAVIERLIEMRRDIIDEIARR